MSARRLARRSARRIARRIARRSARHGTAHPRAFAVAIAALALCAVTTGCAWSRGTFAAPRDYHAYRRFAVEDGLGPKLAASWAYLRDHKEGAFREEVAAFFEPHEARFWADAALSIGGARAYLAHLPDGPHAEDARTYCRAWELEQREAPLRAQKALAEAKAKAQAARRALGEALEGWTRLALTIESYGQERKALEGTRFGDAYFKEAPAPICDADGCSKAFTFTYPAPNAETAVDRTAVLEVHLEGTPGQLTGIALVLPKQGFLAWLEGTEDRRLDVADQTVRAESVMRARNRVESLVRQARGADCVTDEADEFRRVTCGELRVSVGTTAGGNDLVRIGAVPK